MAKKLTHWYPRYTSDYQEDTKDLTFIEHGAYSQLLDHYYSSGNPLPTNVEQLCRVCRAFCQDEKDALDRILNKFFTLVNNEWHNKRADEELLRRSEISEKRRNARNGIGTNDTTNDTTNVSTNVDTATATSTSTLAAGKDFCDEEILPPSWQDYAEAKGIPNEQIFTSWRKFKDTSKRPWKRLNWEKWTDVERVKK